MPRWVRPRRGRGRGDRGRTAGRIGAAGVRETLLVLIGAPGLRTWTAIVGAAIAVGTAGYVVLEGWNLLDALYMTVISVTTVGFKEVRDLDASGRVWTMIMSGTGVVLVFGTVGIVTEYLITEATSGRSRTRLMAKAVGELRGHYVVCGYGRVGSTVARELVHEGTSFAVIDVNPASLERARADGHLIIEGDATDDTTLRAAGIERARGLISTIDSDAQNVYVILSARALNPDLLIVGRASTPSAEEKLARAGADRIVSPYTMAGRRLAELAIRPRVVDFLDAALSHGELSFSLEELHVTAGGRLDGASVAALRARGLFVLAVLPESGRYEANPPDDRRLRVGETIIGSGSGEAFRAARDDDPEGRP
jgi:voltage-gated potassium channel